MEIGKSMKCVLSVMTFIFKTASYNFIFCIWLYYPNEREIFIMVYSSVIFVQFNKAVKDNYFFALKFKTASNFTTAIKYTCVGGAIYDEWLTVENKVYTVFDLIRTINFYKINCLLTIYFYEKRSYIGITEISP